MCIDRFLIDIPKHPMIICKLLSTFQARTVDGNKNPYFSLISDFEDLYQQKYPRKIFLTL